MNILVTNNTTFPNYEAKLRPLSKSKKVGKIFLVTKKRDRSFNKLEIKNLPHFISHHNIISKFLNFVITPLIMIYLVKKLKINLILSYHIVPHAFFAYFASKITNIPYNVSQIGILVEKFIENKYTSKFFVETYNQSSFINVPGDYTRNHLVKHGINSDKIINLHSTIDTNFFRPLNLEKKYDVVYLGVLQKLKQVHLIVYSIFLLNSLGLKTNNIIIGEGPQSENLKKLCKDLNIDNINFVGWVSEREKKVKLLNESKILVVCSKMEGLPIALMEGMACGLPVVASNVGNISTVVKNNENGFLLDNTNVVNISKSLFDLLQDKKKHAIYSKNARRIIRTDHSFEKSTSEWNKILSKLV